MSDTDNPGLLAYHEAARDYRESGGMALTLTDDEWLANRKWAEIDCPASDYVPGYFAPVVMTAPFEPVSALVALVSELIETFPRLTP